MPVSLTKGAVKRINNAVDRLFDKVKARFLGPDSLKGDKRVTITYKPDLTLKGLYESAAREEHTKGSEAVLNSLLRIAGGYLDAKREHVKTQTVNRVESFLRDAQRKGVETDLNTVLGGELYDIWSKAHTEIKSVIEAESNKAKNMGTLEGVTKVNASMGIKDPIIAFIGPNDNETCEECKRLLLLDDEVTPRVFKLSEVGHGYHKRGDNNPKMGGLHPHCRHSLVSIMPGYGFKDGNISFISLDHSEYDKQHA